MRAMAGASSARAGRTGMCLRSPHAIIGPRSGRFYAGRARWRVRLRRPGPMLKSRPRACTVLEPDMTLTIRPISAGEIPLIEELMPQRMPGTHEERMEKQKRGEALYLIAW